VKQTDQTDQGEAQKKKEIELQVQKKPEIVKEQYQVR